MALKAGRVGVAKDQVDEFGKIIGGETPENVYTKTQCDNKFETKAHIGGLQFRDNSGTAQYKLPNGEWVNFSSGGGDTLGFNIPDAKKITTGIEVPSNVNMVDGCYCIENNVLYVDMHISMYSTTGSAMIKLLNALPAGVNMRHTLGILCTDISVMGVESVTVSQSSRDITVNIGNNHWANEVVHVFGTAQLVSS